MPNFSIRTTFPPMVAVFVLIMASMACINTPTPPPPTQEEAPTNPPAPLPAPASLSLDDVRLESYNDSYYTYQVIATIKNSGGGEASGFSAGCTYQCPAGDTMISGGLDVVQGGYIAPNSSFQYKSPVHYMCTLLAPSVDLECTLTSSDGSTQTRTFYGVTFP